MIIKSDKGVYYQVITCLIVGIIFFIAIEWNWLRISVSTFLIILGFIQWIECGKTLLMDREGCTVCFWCIRKKYSWNDLKTKRIEQWDMPYAGIIPENRRGVFFSQKDLNDKSFVKAVKKAGLLSSFYIWFTIDCSMRHYHHILPEMYNINEEEFMQKMHEWGVKLEVIDEQVKKTYTYTDAYLVDMGLLKMKEKIDIKMVINDLNIKLKESVRFYKRYRLYRVLEGLKYNQEIGIIIKPSEKSFVVRAICEPDNSGNLIKTYYVDDMRCNTLDDIRHVIEKYCDEKSFILVGVEECDLLEFKVRPIEEYKDYE